MSKPEYTEGPWVWGHSGIDGLWVGPFDETPVAIVPHDGGLEGVPSRDNSRNNARLIAAAPELLEALEDVLSIVKNDGQLHYGETPEDESYITFEASTVYGIESDITSAIAKAKGE